MTDVPTNAVPRGQLYLGEQIDAATHSRDGTPVTLAASDFTTHGVIVGMTGSGKTGLGVVLLEEALLSGVPALIIDPKGDLTNLELTFPELRATDFRPWINDGDAERAGVTPDAFADQEATRWRDGLASWGVTPERIAALRAAVDFTIYTPGSTSGVPLNLVGSLQAPKGADAETIGDEVEGFVSGLLGLVDIQADPLSSREHILLSNIVAASWNEGRDLDLATLVGQVQSPPMRKLGVFEVDTFFPPADRTALALRLNGLLASPSFAAWAQGVPFDIDRLLKSADGKPAAAIVTIAHLSDAERQFVVSLLLGKLVTWMRRQSGTTDLRALVYMDEVAGYAPPTAEPPSKKPILTLLKQARAFGVGLVLSTQNPVDLDYKAISNAGTWMVGRLQTEQDKKRLLDGMSAAGGGVDVNELGRHDQRTRQAGVRAAPRGCRSARRVHDPLGDGLSARTAHARADRVPHAQRDVCSPSPASRSRRRKPSSARRDGSPDGRRVAGRSEGRRQRAGALPRSRHSLGGTSGRCPERIAPRRRGCRASEHGVRRGQGGTSRGAGVGGGAVPIAGHTRSVRSGRGRLRRAQPRGRGSAGSAVRAVRRADRHQDVLDFTPAQPGRPARTDAHDADPAQLDAEALLTRG